jgi:hypothetical protein
MNIESKIMIFLFSSVSFALSMLDVTSGVLGRSPFQISGTQDVFEEELKGVLNSSYPLDMETDVYIHQVQLNDVQKSMNNGNWSKSADIWRFFLQKSTVKNAWFMESEKGLFLHLQEIKNSQDLDFLLYNYSLQTWYIICLTRAGKHFEAQYQLNKWAKSLGLNLSEEQRKKRYSLFWKKEKNIQDWLDVQIEHTLISHQVGQPNDEIVSKVGMGLGQDEKEIVIWLLSEYRILRSWVEGEQGMERVSLSLSRQARWVLDGYILFQNEHNEFTSDNLDDNEETKQELPTGIDPEMSFDIQQFQNDKREEIQIKSLYEEGRKIFYEGSLFAIDILEMRSWMSLKRHKRAYEVLERRKSMSLRDLDDAWLWYELGVESLWKGDDEEGLIYLERAIHSKYSSPLHVQALFIQLVERQNFALALRFVIDGIQRFPNSNLLPILLREMDNPGLRDYWKQSSQQPERKWVRAIWGIYVSQSLIGRTVDFQEDIGQQKKEQIYELLRTSFLFPETSEVVMEKYFLLSQQMKLQDIFLKDMISLSQNGKLLWKEHRQFWLEILSFYSTSKMKKMEMEVYTDFMKVQLRLYQDIYEQREDRLSDEEQKIAEQIAEHFVYFYRDKSLEGSLFWMREFLYWKGWSSGSLLSIWCPYLQDKKILKDLFSLKPVGMDKMYCSDKMDSFSESSFQDMTSESIPWILYYAYLWNQILEEEEISLFWSVQQGELTPVLSEDLFFVKEGKSKYLTTLGLKSIYSNGDLEDVSKRKILLSNQGYAWFLERYYAIALVSMNQDPLVGMDDLKYKILLLYNWIHIYEELHENKESKFYFLKQIFLQLIDSGDVCVEREAIISFLNSEDMNLFVNATCFSGKTWKDQKSFSVEQKELLEQMFPIGTVGSMEKKLFLMD